MTNHTDDKSYSGADSGCPEATEKLGRPSSCLECPFPYCIYESGSVNYFREQRNAKIIQMDKEGKTVGQIAVEMGIGGRTVQRVISGR